MGLQLEQTLGVNPYKFGLVGATDAHTGLAAVEEENFFGKHAGTEPSAERVEHPMARVGDLEYPGWSTAASGYQGVWATENTREALFDAMMRKETYATTGPRMVVRFFGGWEFVDRHRAAPAGGDPNRRSPQWTRHCSGTGRRPPISRAREPEDTAPH